MSHVIQPKDIEAYLQRFTITPSQYQEIKQMDQRSDAWLKARNHRITGSRFGACAGHCRFQTPSMCVRDMLWSSFRGNAATAWGTTMEPIACEAYVKYLKKKRKDEGFEMDVYVEESGLHVRNSKPWYAASPDGLVYDVKRDADGAEVRSMGLLEIKCPYSKKDKSGSARFYKQIPQNYYDQIQGLMAIITENGTMQLDWADFHVWTPTGFQITRFSFDATYWEALDTSIEQYYRKMFLPALIWKERGLLKNGDIQYVPTISLPYSTYADWFKDAELHRCEQPLSSSQILARFTANTTDTT